MGMDTRERTLAIFQPYGLTEADAIANNVVASRGAALDSLHASEVLAAAHAHCWNPVHGAFQNLSWRIEDRPDWPHLRVGLSLGMHNLAFQAPPDLTALRIERSLLGSVHDKADPFTTSAVVQCIDHLAPLDRAAFFEQLAADCQRCDRLLYDAEKLQKNAPWRDWLLGASRAGHVGALNACLGRGASANRADVNGNTALHHAARFGHQSLIQPLVEHGARLEARNHDGNTPLHVANTHGHEFVALELMAHGADSMVLMQMGRREHRREQAAHL